MSVLIDQFDVESSEGPGRPPSPPPAPVNTAGPPTAPDIEQALEHQREREARVWAH